MSAYDDIDAFLDGSEPTQSEMVSASELGEWLGITGTRINKLARDGILPRQRLPRGGGLAFPLKAAVRAYADHSRAGAAGRRVDPDLAAEKLRLTRAQADKAEQLAGRARGELLDAQAVALTWAGILTDLRAAILAIPQRVAGASILDAKATDALDQEIRSALEAIADDR